MNPEDYLDDLIENMLHDAGQPEMNDDEAARIEAAMAIARLQSIEPPPALAERLEARIRVQARAHHNGHVVSLERARQNGHASLPEPRPLPRPTHRRLPLIHRAWIGALAAAAVLVLALLGVSQVAARSLPGDPLYSVKSFEQQMALSNANSPEDRANVQITQLQGAITDLETEVGNGRSDADILQALNVVTTDTRDSQTAVAAVPAGSAHDAAAQSLATTLQQEQATLYRLLARVDWSLRVTFSKQLGALGVSIPTLTKVTVIDGSNNTITLTLTGANFAPGAQVTINGRLRGTVITSSPTELIVTINGSDWHEDDVAVGVLNPDGTAAQKFVSDDGGHDGSDDGGDDHGGHGTPTPGATPTSGSDDGGHGGGGGGGDG